MASVAETLLGHTSQYAPKSVYTWVGLLLLMSTAWWVSRRPKDPLPPGPPGIPIFGNTFQLSKTPWLKFTDWSQEYGPIFSLNMAGQPMVIVNTGKVGADLLDRRSAIYSDRPRFIMAAEILTGGMLVGFAKYGPIWRRLRKAAHLALNIRACESYYPVEEREAAILVQDFLREPTRWQDHIRRSITSTLFSIIYSGKALETPDHPTVRAINNLMERVVKAAAPGAFLVEIMPWMLHLPDSIAKWKREGKQRFKEDSEMFKSFLGDVRKQVATGDYKPSIGAHLVYPGNPHNLNADEQAWLAGIIFGGGSDTSTGALSYFMLQMSLHPEIQAKAHEEIDRVVGRHRMPNFGDRPNLPYVNAIVKEVLRWHPVSPLGLPHRLTQDDWYEGYFLPEGTIVLTNLYGMNRDPELFPDPEKFDPDRYYDESRDLTKQQEFDDTHGQGHFSYGFGRRICVGMNLANNSVFINIVSMLWAVSIKRAIGPDGKEIIPDSTKLVDSGLIVHPEPFECVIEPRGGEVSGMLALAREKAVD